MSKDEVGISQREAPELAEIRRELNQVAWPSDVEKIINLINLYKDHSVEFARGRALPPVIEAVAFSNPSTSSAQITWTTDAPSDSVVKYGATTALGSMVSDPMRVTSHSITLYDLTAGTTYYYMVASTDLAGNRVVDSNNGMYYTFIIRAF